MLDQHFQYWNESPQKVNDFNINIAKIESIFIFNAMWFRIITIFVVVNDKMQHKNVLKSNHSGKYVLQYFHEKNT